MLSNRHTHTQTTVTLAAHARRGLTKTKMFITFCIRKITPQVKAKEKFRKATKVHVYPNVSACLRELTEVVTSQLDTVIIEESSVIALSLSYNPWRLYRAKHLPLQNGIYGDAELYSAQTTYHSMKVLTFAKNKNI